MPDQIKICANCHNPFVYSEYEQTLDRRNGKPEAIYCPICASIKASEALHPRKPEKVSSDPSSSR